MTDILFITPNNAKVTYQALSNKYSAIEPPTWALILAESCRQAGHDPKILDCLAENLGDDEAIEKIVSMAPKVICFAVYGQNVNAGTTNMSGAVRLAELIKAEKSITAPIGFVGSHVQALPKETLLKESCIGLFV